MRCGHAYPFFLDSRKGTGEVLVKNMNRFSMRVHERVTAVVRGHEPEILACSLDNDDGLFWVSAFI